MISKRKLAGFALILAGTMGIGKTASLYHEASKNLDAIYQELDSKHMPIPSTMVPLSELEKQNPIIVNAHNLIEYNQGILAGDGAFGALSAMILGSGYYLAKDNKNRKSKEKNLDYLEN